MTKIFEHIVTKTVLEPNKEHDVSDLRKFGTILVGIFLFVVVTMIVFI